MFQQDVHVLRVLVADRHAKVRADVLDARAHRLVRQLRRQRRQA